MIQANELRIGIYFRDPQTKQIGRITRENVFNALALILDYGGAEGIPLSHELLEKAGFINKPTETYPYCYEKEDGNLDPDWTFRIWWWRDDICIEPFGRDKGLIGIKYLHQLQNIYFALLGRELEINL